MNSIMELHCASLAYDDIFTLTCHIKSRDGDLDTIQAPQMKQFHFKDLLVDGKAYRSGAGEGQSNTNKQI